MLQPYIRIGRVTRPHGLRGEVRVDPCTDDPARFGSAQALPLVYMERGGVFESCRVMSARVVGAGGVVIALEGVADRAQAEALRGQWLYVDRAHAVKSDPEAEFICDLIGCGAYDEAGAFIGEVEDVLQPGGNDVYVIRTATGSILTPALKFVVTAVDVAARRVTLDRGRLNETAVFD
ncbi:MAG: ribosome maturation factor RimM [Oscillospiraceae bacterium]|jgi:16S rRNA processing protein RimM|nr:ribosome maturation factor RimM [Oscillospiraceae bacterium]